MNITQLSYIPNTEDPKEVILKKLGNALDKFPDIYGSRVLVATAPSPDRKGLILVTDKFMDEGRWQGKVGLILKLGVNAFEYDPKYPSYKWEGPKPQVGDWVYFNPSDAKERGVGGISCRMIWDSDIEGNVTNIEAIY